MSVEDTVTEVDDVIALATKLPEDQSPLSKTRLPEPTIEVLEEKSSNAKVCPWAKVVIEILEFIETAVAGSDMVALRAELEELTFNAVFPVNVVSEVDNDDKALLISAIAEIEVVLSSIFDWIIFSWGAFSAWTKLSTIWVIFKPLPDEFKALK